MYNSLILSFNEIITMVATTPLKPTASDLQEEETPYLYISTHPLNGALGAEVDGIDLASGIDDKVYTEIRQAFIRHLVLVFRDQSLSPMQMIQLGSKFGDLHINPFVKGMEGHPGVIEIKSEENAEKQFTGLWHSDISWDPKPSLGSLLYAVDIPDFGGDTLFTNMYEAYATLSSGMQKMLLGLRARHTANRFHSSSAEHGEYSAEGALHPVVITHPETGKKALFINEYFTTHFEGMTKAESESLLTYLFQHSVRPDFTCRIRWEKGTLVIWDNRSTMHYATNDYPGKNRLMHRVTIEGEAPV